MVHATVLGRDGVDDRVKGWGSFDICLEWYEMNPNWPGKYFNGIWLSGSKAMV
jgi:hypothetical protein